MENKNLNNILLNYNQNDFFYVRAKDEGILPTLKQCEKLNPYNSNWDMSCNKNYSDNAQLCFQKELCKNRDASEWLQQYEFKHSGSNQKYLDTKQKYNEEFLNILNLGFGITFMIFMLYSQIRK